MTSAATGSGAAAAAAVANAIKASGAIVQVTPEDFIELLYRAEAPLVVCAPPSTFSRTDKYLFNYKGLFFYTKSKTPLQLPDDAEIVKAKTIWIPG